MPGLYTIYRSLTTIEFAFVNTTKSSTIKYMYTKHALLNGITTRVHTYIKYICLIRFYKVFTGK